jgi:hypothetical protein
MSEHAAYERFKDCYFAMAERAHRENRMLLNHVCIRVEDIAAAERLLADSFGITGFVRARGALFEGEREVSVNWIGDEFYLELSEQKHPQQIGYDTGSGQPIGHLSEVGFFVPDLDRELERLSHLGWKVTDAISNPGARMVKIDTDPPSGFPVELIEIRAQEISG